MDYDSDSELHATDTLRLDSDSEDENVSHHTPVHEPISDNTNQTASVAESASDLPDVPTEPAHENIKTADYDTEEPPAVQKRRTKVAKIIDSDSEDEVVPEKAFAQYGPAELDTRTTNMNRLKSLVDSDSEPNEHIQTNKQTPLKKSKKKKNKNRPEAGNAQGILQSGDEQLIGEGKENTKAVSKPKRKKQTESKKTAIPVATAKDMLAGLNLFFCDDDDDEKNQKPSILLNSASDNDSDIESNRLGQRSVQKMTEKQALEERQIIQSESQRMAREAYIDVPYHRTKAYSFEEFLARKTIRKADPSRDCSSRSSDLSIKMTPEQLEMFARQLKERELESQEFFKSESESSDEEHKKEDAPSAELTRGKEACEVLDGIEENARCAGEVDTQEKIPPTNPISTDNGSNEDTAMAPNEAHSEDPIDEIVNRTSENMEKLISNLNETSPNEKESRIDTEIKYDLITADVPNEKGCAVTKKASMLAKLNLPPCPRLSGHLDMLIDLDSGNLEPKEPSGADILFQRLAKCSGSARMSAPSKSTVTVLGTDDGVVKLNKISLFSEEERPLVNKEPIPGAAYLKLKQALKEQIDNDRRAAMQKREEEYAKKMELEKEEMGYESDEEVEELLDDEDDDPDDENEEKTDVAGQQKTFFNDEAMDDDIANEDDENEDDRTSDNSSTSDDDEQCADERDETFKRKGRIIKAFEDSDDENVPDKSQEMAPTAADTDAQRGFTQSEDNELASSSKTGENVSLPWTSDNNEVLSDDDLMELCSGRFATQLPPNNTQMPTQILTDAQKDAENHLNFFGKDSPTKALYTQAENRNSDSQLMELCSGRFETQLPVVEEQATQLDTPDEGVKETAVSDNNDILGGGKLRLDSSDDEANRDEEVVAKKSKKPKKRRIQLSDNEDEATDHEHPESEHSDVDELGDEKISEQDVANEEDEAERYVDYDSEENEVEVKLTKKEKKKILANFVENEAELSESEWGSSDEDEKDLDRYDVELADAEQYDQTQLQQELEKIHNRQMLDQDNREVEQLKEFFLEDEENDGIGRVRQFRWKNVEKTFSLDYDKHKEEDNENEEEATGDASDEETELMWRKMRYERYMLMKEQYANVTETELVATTLLNPEDTNPATDAQENNQSVCNISAVTKKKITIVKRTTTATTGKEDSPFLISKSSVVQGHKASFLSRDAETLNKLANLVKSNPETDGASTVMAAKGRNFVFTALSPAIDKTSKRSLDPEDAEEKDNVKRAKTSKETTSKKKLLLGSLM